jgi:hypothetical protein
MFDDDDGMGDDGNGLQVSYAIPSNGASVEERLLYCHNCKGITTVDGGGGGGSIRKRKEGMAIKYMCMAEDKVFDRLNNGLYGELKNSNLVTTTTTTTTTTGGGDDDMETQHEIDQQFLQMATSVCGSQHWSTHFRIYH